MRQASRLRRPSGLTILTATLLICIAGIPDSRTRIHASQQLGVFQSRGASSPGFIPESTPPNPNFDIPWNPASYSGVADIQAAFNNARQNEATQLSISLPPFVLVSQSEWDMKSPSRKALFLINLERTARGVKELDDLDPSLSQISQAWADYLMANNLFSHYDAANNGPWERMSANPVINACNDAYWAENIFYLTTSGDSIPLPIERSIYYWMYTDSSSAWGHRVNLLYGDYIDNCRPPGKEGFLGIGLASGPYRGFNLGIVVVLDTFDPCSSWSRLYLPYVTKPGP